MIGRKTGSSSSHNDQSWVCSTASAVAPPHCAQKRRRAAMPFAPEDEGEHKDVASPLVQEAEHEEGPLASAVEDAARAIAEADAMVIGTGAGMGVDSGLGTFRGRNAGVWEPLKAMQRDFSEMSCPDVFEEDERAAWAFWKFRHDTYTGSDPHDGYKILSAWGARMKHGCWSITSNIDGHWARTPGMGAERTYEMDGSLTYMQTRSGHGPIWPTDGKRDYQPMRVAPWDLQPGERVEVLRGRANRTKWESSATIKVAADSATIVSYDDDGVGGPVETEGVRRAGGPDLCRVEPGCPLPCDPTGAEKARPNVLMFGDGSFNGDRIDSQEARYQQWLDSLDVTAKKLVVVEVGAGTAVPTIRMACDRLLQRWAASGGGRSARSERWAQQPKDLSGDAASERRATFVRINLDQSEVGISRSTGERVAIGGMGALEALKKLDTRVRALRV